MPYFSLLEKMINKGPFPNAQTNIISRLLNIFLYSCILPMIGFIYVRLLDVRLINYEIFPREMPAEIIIGWIAIFLFSYTYVLYYASMRVREYLSNVRSCLDYDEKSFKAFEEETSRRIFSPSYLVLIALLVTIYFGFNGVISNPIYIGDVFTTILIGLILVQSTFLNWIASWMLASFLVISNKFGKAVPIRVNPFDPDRVGGLAPLSDLSTLAIFDVGLLALIVIPMWYLFYSTAAFLFIFVTSILIPCYFFYSMRGVYEILRKEKEHSLREMNDELQQLAGKIRAFIAVNHKEEMLNEEKLTALGQTLNSLNIIHERVKSMHTFPVNSEIMIKVIVSAILPIIGIVANVLVEAYL